MNSIRVHEFGDASQLVFEDIPVPEPESGEVRVKVEAAGLNFVEIYQRKGLYPGPLPRALGSEFSGRVDAIGEGVRDFRVGDRVATARGRGSYAGYAIAPASMLVQVPEPISLEQAAAVMLQGMTAHYLARSTFPLKSGDKALIHAAAGGVGQLLVQIAKKSGAYVIATVSTEEKAEIARQAGADAVILYSKDDFEVEVKRLTHNEGVEVVYDGVGKKTFSKGLNSLKIRGTMVLFGQASGPVESINPQILNQKGSLYLTRPTLSDYMQTHAELLSRAEDLFNWMTSGELKVRIDKTFPLKDASAAQRYMEQGSTKGKILLLP